MNIEIESLPVGDGNGRRHADPEPPVEVAADGHNQLCPEPRLVEVTAIAETPDPDSSAEVRRRS